MISRAMFPIDTIASASGKCSESGESVPSAPPISWQIVTALMPNFLACFGNAERQYRSKRSRPDQWHDSTVNAEQPGKLGCILSRPFLQLCVA